MFRGQQKAGGRLSAAFLLGGASWYALRHTGPLYVGDDVNILTAAAWGFVAFSGAVIASDAFKAIAGALQWIDANTPKGRKATSRFVKSLREVRDDLLPDVPGPFWGAFAETSFFLKRRKPVVADFKSNALVVGTTGSGKGITLVQPNALAIAESKVIVDLKIENAAILANALRERGEEVFIINLGDVFSEIIGESDHYNFLALIIGNFYRRGSLMDVDNDCFELTSQLVLGQKKGKQKSEDMYWDNGGQDFLSWAIQFTVLSFDETASLGDVGDIISDRDEMLKSAQWAAGKLPQKEPKGTFAAMPFEKMDWLDLHDTADVESYIRYFRKLSAKVAGLLENRESKSADVFLTIAQNALGRFNIATRAHRKTNSSTFNFGMLKEGKPKTVFLGVDASRLAAQTPVISLLQHCMLTELKRHPDKKRSVYILADEATNFKIEGLGDSLLTWSRGFGIRFVIFIQNLAAFRDTYGKEAEKTLLSETEIKIFLPGQREQDTIKLIQSMMGDRAWIERSRRGNREKSYFSVDGIDYREDHAPLMTEDEIKRTDKSIFFLRRNRPMLIEPVSIAEIEPYRSEIDVNPFHGQPFLLPVKLRLGRHKPSLIGRFLSRYRGRKGGGQ